MGLEMQIDYNFEFLTLFLSCLETPSFDIQCWFFTHTHTHTHTNARLRGHKHTHTRGHKHTHTRGYWHTHTHTHMLHQSSCAVFPHTHFVPSPPSRIECHVNRVQNFKWCLTFFVWINRFLNSFMMVIFLIWRREFCEWTGVKRADIVWG